ncbi:hypothetical protein MED193_15432 [Roseobacter sp. MED193]|uniref:hypothetical protein n=1 Tax=Roseobacter sp. MED193 TaxID=314262 RepID=UPI000068C10C|nr:hypothetical protein [Roseobacter sp. MED193]EAQ46600.1 hypothetical protein MED193_15432 [Roseobacter sp. MED193]
MQEPFDWEQAMETTRRSAAAASQNSENAVAGLSKLLRVIDHHSNKLANLTKAINQLEATQKHQVNHSKSTLERTQGENRHSWRLPALGLLAVFAVGVVFGGSIVN